MTDKQIEIRIAVIFWVDALLACSAPAQTTVTTTGGTTNTVPVFAGSSTVNNSSISVSGGNVGISTTAPGSTLDILGSGNPTITLRESAGAYSSFLTLQAAAGGSGVINTTGATNDVLQLQTTDITRMLISASGVGIGTTAPSQTLEVNGTAQVDGALNVSTSGIVFPNGGGTQTAAWTGVLCGGDYAESVDMSGRRTSYEPGDVMVVDPSAPGNFVKASKPYSTLVAGIYSTKSGAVGKRSTDPVRLKKKIPMAMIGIVPTKVSAENGAVGPGDLLITSSTHGYAMKETDRARMTGAIVGKALGSVQSGTGMIEVLVTLQ